MIDADASRGVILWRARAEDEREMKAFLREMFYICCMVIAALSEIAAATIGVAIATNKLTDSQDWLAVAFFAAIGCAAWVAGRQDR